MNQLYLEVAEWRKPKIEEATEIFSEPGRIIQYEGGTKVDYSSHWFVFAKAEYGGYVLYVKNGGGEERLNLSHRIKAIVPALNAMSSDERFLMFWEMMDIEHKARREAAANEAMRYQAAFVDGRLKKRKLPAQGRVRVWIEPKL